MRDGNIAGFTDELIYETITLKDCHYSNEERAFYYLCPCGDLFEFPIMEIQAGNLISECPSCSLKVRLDLKEGELDAYLVNQ